MTTITALPTAPARTDDPAVYIARADAMMAALPAFVTETNAVAAAMNLNSTTGVSTTSLLIGTGSKSLTVETGKSFVVGMSVKIAYTTSPANWMHGDVTAYTTGTGALVVNVTATAGSGTQAAWTVSLSGPGGATLAANTFTGTQSLSGAALNEAITVTVASATSTAIGAAASNNVDISGTTTITSFDTVTEGINRKGRFTGALTLTHNGTSLILPGVANITTAANDRYEARSLGSGNWIVTKYERSSGLPIASNGAFRSVQTFTGSGTYTPTTGMTRCKVSLVAGGGAGGSSSTGSAAGGGGGGGGSSMGIYTAAQIGASQVVTVGAGGTAAAGNGNAGGTTSLGALISATGGAGGTTGGSAAVGGAGGVGSGGSLNMVGGAGGGGGATSAIISGKGGNSHFGGGARGVIGSVVGIVGGVYGGGGSGGQDTASTDRNGGAGAIGAIFIEEFF